MNASRPTSLASVFALALGLVLALAVPASAQDIPDLQGVWIMKSSNVYIQQRGFVQTESETGTFEVYEQRGHVFHGKKTWTVRGESREEAIMGMIDIDGSIFISEAVDGFCFGRYLSDGSLVLYYVESGPDGRAVQSDYVRQ